MGCETAEEINASWDWALKNPIPPVRVERGACQEVVLKGKDLEGECGGLGGLPAPISTPGFDNAPYTTCSHWVTKHPETGIRNVGNYRGQIKSNTRAGVYVLDYKDFWHHWRAAKALGKPLEAALVIGGPPFVSYAAVQPVPYNTDEIAIAGGLAGEPIEVIRCKTVDLEVPAQAEIVIEGQIPTDELEPEGPFGESYGYVQLKNMEPFMNVTCITHRRDAIYVSFISQVTPSESSKIKEVGYEPMLLKHLRDDCSIPGVLRVAMHEPLANLRPYVVIQFRKPNQSDVWRAMYAVLGRYGDIGKVIVAVDGDNAGNLYTVGRNAGAGVSCPVWQIHIASPSLVTVGFIPAPSTTAQCSPSGLAFNAAGDLFAAEGDKVFTLTPDAATPPNGDGLCLRRTRNQWPGL